jgi:hypothetical protein
MVLASGCIVEDRHSSPTLDTQISFDETMNIGACVDPAQFSWTVYNRQTRDQGTAGCSQSVLFRNLAPDTTYTFDVTGYLGSQVCWQGACNVDTRYGIVTYADCSAQIQRLCAP